jgi:hypothetical protein
LILKYFLFIFLIIVHTYYIFKLDVKLAFI